MCCRHSQAVRLSAFSTSWVTANLLVRSMPTKRQSFPSAVRTSAISPLVHVNKHCRAMDMKEPDWVTLELLAPRLVPLDIRQARDAVSLQAPVQRRPRQVRDRRLEGITAGLQRQQRMTTECDNRRFFGLGQDRRSRFFRTRLHALDRHPLAPLGHGLWVDAQFPAQLRERSLRSLSVPPRVYRRAKLSENCPLRNRHQKRRPRSGIHPLPDSALKMHEKVSSANVRCGWR